MEPVFFVILLVAITPPGPWTLPSLSMAVALGVLAARIWPAGTPAVAAA